MPDIALFLIGLVYSGIAGLGAFFVLKARQDSSLPAVEEERAKARGSLDPSPAPR